MIGIINYGMRNLCSAANTLSFLGVDFSLISTGELEKLKNPALNQPSTMEPARGYQPVSEMGR